MSELAMGTYLGDFSDEDSIMYRESIKCAIEKGIKRFDTAINYRGMRSERDLGVVLNELFSKGTLKREDIIISTKAGFIPGDGEIMLKPVDYLQEKFICTGLLEMSDIHMNSNLRMTMHTNFYDYAMNLSLEHMKLDYIDIHYIHEPELTKEIIGETEFYKNLEGLLYFYEKQITKGIIKSYGMATWLSFQEEESHPRYLSLEKIVKIAKSVKSDHHFKHIMLPYNMDMQEAGTRKCQKVGAKYYTVFEAANRLGLKVSTSGSIGRAENINIKHTLKDYIDFNKNNTDIDVVIIGMKQQKHLLENIKLFYGSEYSG